MIRHTDACDATGMPMVQQFFDTSNIPTFDSKLNATLYRG